MNINRKKGMSLIMLVITIAVMAIIAAVVILNLRSTRIMNNANQAVQDSDAANAKDVVALAGSEWELEEEEIKREGYSTFKEYAEHRLKSAGYKIGNNAGQVQVTEDGALLVYKEPVIPEGFVASDLSTEDEVSEGLVIYEGTDRVSTDSDAQTTRNQFVWVPVPNMEDFTRKNYTGISDFSKNYTETSSYNGDTSYQYPTEVEEYNAMYESVETYGGFYIARYEAGDGKATKARTSSSGTSTVVSKKGAYVYNYVGWGDSMTSIGTTGAVYLSKNMYPENDNYTTHLIYGVQWDATLNFLKDKYDILDSKSWGNYNNSVAPANVNNGSSNMNYTTGRSEAWKAKNIYDLAGNVREWTMEAGSSEYRVRRGGHCGGAGDYDSAARRYDSSPVESNHFYGFRPVLYLR